MRKNSKKAINVKVARIGQYHNGNFDDESYVFEGFNSNKYFVSDRYIELDDHFRRPDGLPLEGYGLEIETECWGIKSKKVLADVMQKIIFVLFPADLFKMQCDGSLGHDYGDYDERCIGVECITQVMKKSFIRNNLPSFKAMFDVYFKEFNISAARSGRCGMHVNISNAVFGDTVEKQKEAIRKLHYFVNKHYDFCRFMFKREGDTGYCERMHYENAKTMEIAGGDHYVCLNYSHFDTGRIELRLVGGQKDYYTFRNTMECVFFLTERVRTAKWEDLDDVVKFFKGCNNYVFKRLRDCHLSYETLQKIEQNVKTIDLEIEEALPM